MKIAVLKVTISLSIFLAVPAQCMDKDAKPAEESNNTAQPIDQTTSAPAQQPVPASLPAEVTRIVEELGQAAQAVRESAQSVALAAMSFGFNASLRANEEFLDTLEEKNKGARYLPSSRKRQADMTQYIQQERARVAAIKAKDTISLDEALQLHEDARKLRKKCDEKGC